jgi:hypothetical protein
MESLQPLRPESASSLGLALVVSSITPLILLNQKLVVKAVSGSFCRNYSIDCDTAVGKKMFALGKGEWDIPQLRSMLTATAAGKGAIDAYELDLKREGDPIRHLVIHAHVLDHQDSEALRLVVALNDVTELEQARRARDAAVHEKQVMLRELNHRVANSLQVIASVIMRRVRIAQSEETRTHLLDVHERVMSVATLQRHLASTASGEVDII